jgi:hypothetical protein
MLRDDIAMQRIYFEQWISNLVEQQFIAGQKCCAFMEAKGLFLCSQEPVSGPCLEPAESNPHPHILFLSESF